MTNNDWLSMAQYGAPAPVTDTTSFSNIPSFAVGSPVPSTSGAANGLGAGAAPGGWGSNFMGGMLGGTDANGMKSQGWGGLALGAASALGNAYMGMKQYGLAKDTLAQNKKQFDLNFGAQQKTTNARLEDRQRARVASNGSAYQSVGDYMKANGI